MGLVRRHAWVVFGVTGLALSALYLVLPEVQRWPVASGATRGWLLLGIATLTAAAVLAGVHLHRPSSRPAWLLIAAAVVLGASGHALGRLPGMGRGQPRFAPDPWWSDAVELTSSLLLIVAVLLLVRQRAPGRDRAALLDALIVASAAGLASWTFLIEPVLSQEGVAVTATLLTASYPITGLLVLAAAARLWFGVTGGGDLSLRLLVAALVAVLVSDTAYTVLSLRGDWQGGTLWDLGWLLFWLFVGVAALHPSVAATAYPPRPEEQVSGWRFVVLLGLISLVPTMVAVGRQSEVDTGGLVVVVAGAVFLFLLVLFRMDDLISRLRSTLHRDRAMRDANAALAAASDHDTIYSVAVRTAATLAEGSRSWLILTRPRPQVVAANGEGVGRSIDGAALADLDDASLRSSQLHSPSGLHPALSMRTHESATVARLVDQGRTYGYLVTSSTGALDRQAAASLGSLADTVALAVARVELGEIRAERHTEQRMRRMLEHASDVIAVLDLDLTVRYVTPAAERLVGTPGPLLQGTSWLDLVLPQDRRAARELLAAPHADRPAHGEVRLMARDGAHRYVDVVVARVTDEGEAGYVLTCHDVTERRALEQQLTHQAFHDSLTGLANRALFRDRLEHALARSHRGGEFFAVMFVDLDDFKNVNDSLGHAAGDALLRQITLRLLDAVREQDTVARLGGDEFAILLEDVPDESEAIMVADRILAASQIPFQVAGADLHTPVSIGIAVADGATGNAEDAMRNADLALYEAKNLGKGRFAIFAPRMHELVLDRMQLTTDLRRALEQGEVVTHYQPIVELRTGRVTGVEALARWNHPTRGLLGPGQFITLAEETGLIVPLGDQVLTQALRTVAHWQQASHELAGLNVSVNLSARQLQHPGLIDEVRVALQAAAIDPASVILEITESVLLPDEGVTLDRLLELTELGVRLYIDDFGTGYSSLSYLQQLPVHGIKLAREFVATLSDRGFDGNAVPSSTGLVGTIRSLAETLGLEAVVAEGVETVEQRQALLSLGYHLGQGYLMARPMTAGQFSRRLASVEEESAVGLVV